MPLTEEREEVLQRPRTIAVPYDEALRYFVPSQSDPDGPPHLVELDAFDGNGMCSCQHFQCRCYPLLRRGIGPKEAVEITQIKLKPNRQIQDALRCEHILSARSQFLDEVLREIAKKRTAEHAAQA